MTAQSHPPVILLTRPADPSARFATALRARFPDLHIVTSPLIAPTFPLVSLPGRKWTAVIFTSETAVQAAKRIAADGHTLPELAFCVGDQTAQTAQAAGFQALSAQGDGATLLAFIQAQSLRGPMLYLHGRETRLDIAERLESSGIETFSCLTYAQNAQPLTAEATALLHAPSAILAPVFSPRTGQILAQECARIGATAPLHVVAISAAAGAAFPQANLTLTCRPDATAMLAAIALRLDAP